MKISKRLQLIADFITKYKQGSILGDIGSDHAYLPCYLVKNNIILKAYACDVAKGPLESAKQTIEQYGLEDQVIPLLGSGIDPICDKQVDMVSISGMGSYLICEILAAHLEYLKKRKVLFLQANANIDHLRSYLYENNFCIIDEAMIKEAGHIYELLVVTYHNKEIENYSKKDIIFGPVLRRSQPLLFKEKWEKQQTVYKKIQSTLESTHPKYKEIQYSIEQIEEVLYASK